MLNYLLTPNGKLPPHPKMLTTSSPQNVTDSLFVFFSSLTSVCLRLQSNEDNQRLFKGITPERAFGDFIFAHIILHLVVINFIG